MTAHGPLVEVVGLTKLFRVGGSLFGRAQSLRAVDEVSFVIHRGETLGLVGESGSGKTTVARLLLRLLEPTAGTVRFDGQDIYAMTPTTLRALRRRMQIVFQDASGALNPRMRVGTAVREPIIVHRLRPKNEADQRVAQLFDEVGLDPSLVRSYPHELSGGQRQRVGIARALAVEPEFLVLDEPVSALDVSVQAQVLNLLASLRDRHGLTYCFIAHDLSVVHHLADRVIVMYAGNIMESAPAVALFNDARHPYTKALLSSIPSLSAPPSGARTMAPGDTPSALERPTGCPFHPRCPHPRKDSRCNTEIPVLRTLDADHATACHYADVRDA